MKEYIRRWRIRWKLYKSRALGWPTPEPRLLEKRKYLTRGGIKNWDELTENDKVTLNIIN